LPSAPARFCLADALTVHPARARSARHGFEWWQFDVTWQCVRLLRALGLASSVKLPSEKQKQRMALA
jgi:fatty-acid desaturase